MKNITDINKINRIRTIDTFFFKFTLILGIICILFGITLGYTLLIYSIIIFIDIRYWDIKYHILEFHKRAK